MKGAEDLRWRRNNFILTDGQKINKEIPWFRKLKIDIETDKSQYNLRIANVTAADFGLYLCEMQISKEMSRQIVTLKYKETTSPADVSITTSNQTTYPDTEILRTTSPAVVLVTQNIQTTFPDTEIISEDNMNDQYNNYVLFAAGFIVVLLISIGCNICISNYRQRAMRMAMAQQIKIQNPQFVDKNIQESDSDGEISHVSSKYESINENNMTMPNSTNHEHRIQSQTFNRQSYLEVIGDDDYFASKEATVESSSMTNIKTNTLKPKELFTDNNIDAEVASYHSILSKQFDESDMFLTLNNSIHVDMDNVNKDIARKVNSTKKREFVNPYSTLNTSEMQNYQNYYTAVKHDIEIVIQKEKPSNEKMKRNSYP
ncbi:unnamed protein product [Mytilus coruscus]|uniref:Ig-like domain-containing protein n=1 Tax=Mytilus coruscus TaxID=42192 RepID=A0A6J8DVW3_MYTCO|nr:unnamed protein product [Mytilus coruscus]